MKNHPAENKTPGDLLKNKRYIIKQIKKKVIKE